MTSIEKQSPGKLIAFLVITVSAAIVFLPNLNSEFFLDDNILIKNNPYIRQLESVTSYLAQEDGILDREDWNDSFHTRYYRPLINFTYHIDYRLWGLNPAGFHFTNWLLHLLTSLLLYHILFKFTGNAWGALLTVLLFVLHPVQTEAVSWVSARNNIMATFFSLASFLFYTSDSGRRYIYSMALALFFFSLAIFSKEFGVMALPIFFVYDHIFQKISKYPGKSWLVYLPFIFVLGIYLLARSHVTGPLIGLPGDASFFQRFLFLPYLLMYNICLVFLPAGLHNFLVLYPTDLIALYVAGGVFGMVLVGSLIWRYQDEKLIVFGALSFLIGLFPVLNLIPTSGVTLVAMRWLYFPLAFLSFTTCRIIGSRPGRLKIGVLLLSAALLGGYSFYLNREHWHDEKGFFTREVLKFNNPLYAGAYAKILHQNGDDELADRYFRLGISTFPFLVNTYIDYSAMLIDNNRFRKALSATERGLRFAKGKESRGLLYNNKGMALSKLGMLGVAIAAFEEAVKQSPHNEGFISNLGSAYGMASEYEKSVETFQSGLLIAPDSIGIRKNLAKSYINMGEVQKAVQLLEKIPVDIREKNPGIGKLLQQAQSYRQK